MQEGNDYMTEPLTLGLFEVVGSQLCVASDDGQKVHDQLAKALREGRRVTLSFANVTAVTSAFLNAAVGQLYRSFTSDQIRALLTVEGIEPDDLALLKRVNDTAKEYFRDPERFKAAERTVLGEDEGD